MRRMLVLLVFVHATPAWAQDDEFDAEFGSDPTFPVEATGEDVVSDGEVLESDSPSGSTPATGSDGDAAAEPDGSARDVETDPTLEIVEDADTHWLLSVGASITAALEDDWDDALAAREYGDPSPSYGADVGVLYRVTRWLNLGLRLGARHRYWLHFDLNAATVFTTDILASIDARWSPTRVLQLGIHASGGMALSSVSLNDAHELSVGGRVQVGPLVTLRLIGTLRAMVRLAYDWAKVELVDGLNADLGGFTFLVGFEVRE